MARVSTFHLWMVENLEQQHVPSSRLFVLEGLAGNGKTALITQWLATLSPDDPFPLSPGQRVFFPGNPPTLLAHIFTARTQETPTQMSRRLIEELGHHPLARSAADLWSEAVSHLRTDGVHLIIVDQAERLSLLLCLYLQEYLLDQHCCPLLLVGTPTLSRTIRRDPTLASRVFDWHTITDFDSSPACAARLGGEQQQ